MASPADDESPPAADSIDHQLASARAELAALEQAVDELPEIFEAKFRQGVAAVVESNRQLIAQQLLLRRECASLPPARARSVRVWPWVRPPHLQWHWPPNRQVVRVVSASVGVGLLAWGATRWWHHPQSQSLRRDNPAQQRPAPVAAPSTLVLRAQGTSWVEVQDLSTREVLFMGLLERGQERSIKVRQGLRLRSGRPDLLTLQIDAGPVQPYGSAMGIGWRRVLPAGLRRAGA